VLVLVVVLVLDLWDLGTEKRARFFRQLFCSITSDREICRILEDEHEQEHEHDFSTSAFRFKFGRHGGRPSHGKTNAANGGLAAVSC
jgi:hypothetical protein